VIDLDDIRQCNERLGQLISGEVSEEALQRILDRRAEQMSGRRRTQEERDVLADVIVACRGEAMLGFPVAHVDEVRKNYPVPLAHGNDVVFGLFQSRGLIHSLIDILPLIGRVNPGKAASNCAYVIHLSRDSRSVGVVVDELIGRRVIYRDEVAGGHDKENKGLIASISRDLVSVVDTDALFSSPGIILTHTGGPA
jgi:chemotaxis signal transduction protein